MTEAPSRRQVLAAGAWSVPVVGLATAVPVAAATPEPGLRLVLDWLPYDPDDDWPPPVPGEPYDGPVVVLVLDQNGTPVPGVSVVFVLIGAYFDAPDSQRTNHVDVSAGDGSVLATDIYVAADTTPGLGAVVLTASTAGAQSLVVPLDVSPPAGP